MEQLIQFLSSHPAEMVYLIAFAILLACGLGVPIPEDITLLALGYFCHTGTLDLTISILVAMTGVLIGDATIYMIGRHYGNRILSLPGLRRAFKPARLNKVRDSFDRFGNLFIFMARFAVGLRAVTFWSAGHFRIPFRTFFLYDGLAALISVPLLVYVGMLSGGMIEKVLKYERYMAMAAAAVIIGLIAWTIFQKRRPDPVEKV